MTLEKPTVIAPSHPETFGSEYFNVVSRISKLRKNEAFLAMKLSMLWKKSGFVEKIIDKFGKPIIFFIEMDCPNLILIEKLKNKPWKSLIDRIFAFSDWSEVDRIMHAWGCGVEKETIASAYIEGAKLVVIDASLERLEIEFDQLKSLSKISRDELLDFEIGEWGENLYWPKHDLHIDIIDAIRYRTDQNYRKQKDLNALLHYKEYGKAIKQLRKDHHLTRLDIQNRTSISAKTVQRVEAGSADLSYKTLSNLAEAHGMEVNEYLSGVADTLARNRTTPVENNRKD